MQIRTRLTLQFIFVVTLIIILAFGVIYFSSASYRENELYRRLENKAETTAEIFFSVTEIDSTVLRIIDRAQKDKLPVEGIQIFNELNREVYSNSDTVLYRVEPAMLEQVRKKGKIKLRQKQMELYGMTYNDGGSKFVIFAGAIDIYGMRKLENLRNTILILFMATISIVAVAGWLYAGKALQPISRVINEIEDMNAERLDVRLGRSRNRDEIGQLIDKFNTMLDKIEHAFKLQKLFVSGASHELRNPLTAITSQLQVVLLNDRTGDEYKQIIQSILEDIKVLNRTTFDLIEFARLNYENKIQLNELRIDDVLWFCSDHFWKTNPEYRIQLHLEQLPADEKKLIVKGSEGFLKIAFMNLIDNACKFSPDKTCIVNLQISNQVTTVSFTNRGVGISPEEMAFIFEPFYRTDSTAQTKGHGIGLALTKKIMQLHQAGLEVKSDKNASTTFTVRFHHDNK